MAKKRKPTDDDVKPGRKGRGRMDDEDEDDLDDEPEEVDEEEASKPRSDVYVGLGVVTLLTLLTAVVFLYLDADHYSKQPVQANVAVGDLKLGAPRGQQ